MQHQHIEDPTRRVIPLEGTPAFTPNHLIGKPIPTSQRFDRESMSGELPYPIQGGYLSQPSHPYAAAPIQLSVISSSNEVASVQHLPGAHPLSAQFEGQQQQQQQFQRLKVEDALSYLDQVKLQFGNHPQVYNDFLDIMKEFKAQSIDTPGVINRVSNLFKGHPELIFGFNTFLPVGYKIETQANEIHLHQPDKPSISMSALNQMAQAAAASQQQHIGKPTIGPLSSGAAIHNSQPSQHSYHQPARVLPDTNSTHIQPNSSQPGQQPVEFNHAINYVNKIKNRFQGQPEIYKAFLEILHIYQKEQRTIKEGGIVAPNLFQASISPGHKPLTEAEVYAQVAKLFQNQEDLLAEFGQFLPDANGSSQYQGYVSESLFGAELVLDVRNDHSSTIKKPNFANKNQTTSMKSQLRGSISSGAQQHILKKPRMGTLPDVSLAEAGKWGTLNEYAFFDKVRKSLRHQEVYENFLRCLVLFNQEVISRTELVQLIQSFLGKFPELFKWFKDFLGYKESGGPVEAIPQGASGKERISGELAMEIDYTTCKKYGASYRALPKSYPQPKCSGRTLLCKEVLNDTWVSFPSWSEDSTFVTSRKTQFEEHIYRCEDERFELDVVIETNLSAIRVLESVQKKLTRMAPEDAAKFKLDNCLGGTSEILHRKAIQRIYGDKGADIVDGLKKNPVVAVPLVLRRLKAKDEEWRAAQRNFNKIWREQNEKYYLKSLDHQGINFKQNDIKAIRSKALLNEIETVYDERQDQIHEGGSDSGASHLSFVYKDMSIIEDAAGLIIHHMKRQTSIHTDDKQKIKILIKHFIPDLFFTPRQELSDDEINKEDDEMDTDEGGTDKTKNKHDSDKPDGKRNNLYAAAKNEASLSRSYDSGENKLVDPKEDKMDIDENGVDNQGDRTNVDVKKNDTTAKEEADEDGLMDVAEEEASCRKDRRESAAVALRLKAPSELEADEYFPCFLDMIKNVLDGNLESSSYEDQLREMFGIHAYIAFTMDKLVQNIVRQLQHIVTEESCTRVTQIFNEEKKRGATGGRVATAQQRKPFENVYQKRTEQILAEENCFKIVVYKKECRLTIELLDTDQEPEEVPVEVERWSEYVEKYVNNEEPIDDLKDLLSRKPVFLHRNVRKWMHRNKENTKAEKEKQSEISNETDNLENNTNKIKDQMEINEKRRAENDHLEDDNIEGKRSVHRNKTTDENEENNEEEKQSDDNEDGDSDDNNMEDKHRCNIDIIDNTECKFNMNSFKLVYVVNCGCYLYKRMALQRARQSHSMVSLKLHDRFIVWMDKWKKGNITIEMEARYNKWLLGKIDNNKACTTVKEVVDLPNKSPYYKYAKYKVQYHNEGM